MEYRTRLVDRLLDEFLPHQPATVLSGARAVGKSETARRRAKTVYQMDRSAMQQVVEGDPDIVTQGETPILIDEWQKHPETWDTVRHAVDEDPSPNRFLLTGSSSPRDRPSHPGAGRYLFCQMRPMSLAERDLEAPTVSLEDLLTGDGADIGGTSELTLRDYAEEIERSGFPGIRHLPARLRKRRLASYLETTYTYAIDEHDGGTVKLDPLAMQRWARAYAAATATITSNEKIRANATPRETEKPTKEGAKDIRTALEQAYVIDPIDGWQPSFNYLRKLGKARKHHLTDPALAASLLGVDATKLLQGEESRKFVESQQPLVGQLFESLVAQSVRVYADFCDLRVFHLRTGGGEHEIDLIVERPDGGVVALEVKLAAAPEDRDFRHLSWLKRTIGDRLLDAGIITTGKFAYRHRETGFAVIPAALLGV